MQEKKEEIIQQLIIERVADGPLKVQFSANLGIIKPRAIVDSSEAEERLHFYANLEMKPVMSLGLEVEDFYDMVEKMQAVLQTFAFYGIGWVFELVSQVFAKLARFLPIRGSSLK